jgi:hypothetical protein
LEKRLATEISDWLQGQNLATNWPFGKQIGPKNFGLATSPKTGYKLALSNNFVNKTRFFLNLENKNVEIF